MTTEQRRLALRHMEASPFPVLFSAGTQTRTKRVATRCERAHHYLKGVLEFDPTLRLLVLSPEDWAEYAAVQTYGMPHSAEGETLIVGAATADFFQSIGRMLDDVLTPKQRAEMEAFYGMVDGKISMAPFADLLVVHELGHLFHEQVPFVFPRLWLMELFANLCLHTYVAEAEPEQLPVWTVLPERMMELPTDRVRHRSLEDFEKLYAGVGPENYVWYQCGLVVAAKSIYEAAGVDGLRRLYQTFATQQGTLTDQQLAELLEARVHPVAAQTMRMWPR